MLAIFNELMNIHQMKYRPIFDNINVDNIDYVVVE